jgi:hypothetical protein
MYQINKWKNHKSFPKKETAKCRKRKTQADVAEEAAKLCEIFDIN